MANDADWVADVRRWYFSVNASGQVSSQASGHVASQPAPGAAAVDEPESHALGYEAAHPALQSHHWPDAPRASEFGLMK